MSARRPLFSFPDHAPGGSYSERANRSLIGPHPGLGNAKSSAGETGDRSGPTGQANQSERRLGTRRVRQASEKAAVSGASGNVAVLSECVVGPAGKEPCFAQNKLNQ